MLFAQMHTTKVSLSSSSDEGATHILQTYKW